MFLLLFQCNSSRNCCHLPIFRRHHHFIQHNRTIKIFMSSLPQKQTWMCWCWSCWAVSSPLAQQCKAWMPLHRSMSPTPKIAQALKDAFHISCSRTSGWKEVISDYHVAPVSGGKCRQLPTGVLARTKHAGLKSCSPSPPTKSCLLCHTSQRTFPLCFSLLITGISKPV